MTREEAIERLKWVDPHNLEEKDLDAIDMAIHALMQPINEDWERYADHIWKEAYERGKQEALSAEAVPQTEHDREWIIGCIQHDGFIKTDRFDKANQIILEALQNEQRWIPFKKRPLTDEEKQEYPDWTYIFDCPLPDDEEEILLSNGKYVWTDTFINDGECYLDGGDDIDEGMAWMPLPTPYKESEVEK